MESLQTNYKLTFDVRTSYLFARIEAPSIDRETSLGYLSEIALKCADLRMKKLLIDRRIPEVLGKEHTGSVLAEYVRLSAGMVIALVNKRADINEPLDHFVGKLPSSGASFKVFDTIKAAEKWLVAQPIPDPFGPDARAK